MSLKAEHIDIETFAKYLTNELTSEDVIIFEAWLSVSNQNQEEFNLYKSVWEISAIAKDKKLFNTDVAWGRLNSELFKSTKKKNSSFGMFMGIAASVALLIALGVGFFSTSDTSKSVLLPIEIATASKSQRTIVLSDSTTIYLNENSSLSYESNYFESKTREVFLKGEAFFEVTRNETKPFIVNTEYGKITVLGTSFDVLSKDSSVTVIVASGKVRLANFSNSCSSEILPNEMCTYNATINRIGVTINEDANFISWKTKHLIFNDIPLSQAIADINKTYYSNIVLGNPGLNECLVNVEFTDKSLETIVKVLETTFDLKATYKNDNEIVLSGTGCH